MALCATGRSLLRIPEYQWNGYVGEGAREFAFERSRGRLFVGHCLWSVWGRLPALQLREFSRKYFGSRRTNKKSLRPVVVRAVYDQSFSIWEKVARRAG